MDRDLIKQFLEDPGWKFPKAMKIKSKALHKVFDESRRSKDDKKLRCTCSEGLGLYGLLRLFVESHTEGANAHVASFQACCLVLDLIMQAKMRLRDPVEVASDLEVAACKFLELHKVRRSCLGTPIGHNGRLGLGRGTGGVSEHNTRCTGGIRDRACAAQAPLDA